MSSLYTIQENILRLFADIEANDGEVTDEMYAELEINKDNLKEKLNNYLKAIYSWEADMGVADEEIKRLAANKKVKENRIKRLKSAMLDALLKFGDVGKSGNRTISLPTFTLFTKSTPAVITNDNRISILLGEFTLMVQELVAGGYLYTGTDVELKSILDRINDNLKSQHYAHNTEVFGLEEIKEFVPYTLADLTTLQISITTKQSIYDLFRTGKDALNLIANNPFNTKVSDATAKTDWKSKIETANNINANVDGEAGEELFSYPTVAEVVVNQSLQKR